MDSILFKNTTNITPDQGGDFNIFENVWTFLIFIYKFGNMFTPTIPYLFQLRKFQKLNSSKGFSKKVSMLIILSLILRVYFWFGKRFDWSLLGQAVFMIIFQFAYINECVKFDPDIEEKKTHNFYSLKVFFEWGYYTYYIVFLFLYAMFVGMFFIIFTFKDMVLVELIGSLTAFIEASIVFPQIIKNYKIKSANALSLVLVFVWLIGDLVKIGYYFIANAPLQILICGLTQIFFNFVIIGQVYYYKKFNKEAIEDKNTFLIGNENADNEVISVSGGKNEEKITINDDGNSLNDTAAESLDEKSIYSTL